VVAVAVMHFEWDLSGVWIDLSPSAPRVAALVVIFGEQPSTHGGRDAGAAAHTVRFTAEPAFDVNSIAIRLNLDCPHFAAPRFVAAVIQPMIVDAIVVTMLGGVAGAAVDLWHACI
jgi:hypothetical protein